jgi:ribosome maturation factor RimP
MSKIEQIKELARPLLDRHDCDIVLATLRREPQGRVLRLLVEKKGSDPSKGSGVNHALCAAISRDMGTLLDAEDFISDSFVLEVSSPGIERPLIGPEDFERFKGHKAMIKTMQTIDRSKRFTGVISDADQNRVCVELTNGVRTEIPFKLITKANLVFDSSVFEGKTGE